MEQNSLLVIAPEYYSFVKDQTEVLAQFYSSVNVLVRYNPFAELSRILPYPSIINFRKANLISYKNLPKNVIVSPTPVYYLPIDTQYKKLGEKHLYSVEKRIKKDKIQFNLLHAHATWSSGFVGAELKKKYAVPFIVTAHGYDIYSLPFKDEEWRAKIEYILNMADHVITVSQSNLACIKKLDVSTPITVIPNGFRSDLFYPRDSSECKKMLKLPQDKQIILAVGNLESVKGHKYLLEAVQKIIRERRNILCIIVGTGKLHTTLERQIRSLGLEDYIMLAGRKPHDEIPLWTSACDLFVLPSIRESFGVVQIEAMACGKPVVATRNGGSEEVVTSDEYGLLVEPADPDDLAEKILVALNREWDREVILAYAERYTWESVVKDIIEIHKSLSIGELK